MKKIAALCAGILTVLFLSFADAYIQRQQARQAASVETADTLTEDITVRVLLKTADYASVYHESVTVASKSGFAVQGLQKRSVPAGQEEVFTPADMEAAGEDMVRLVSEDGVFAVRNLARERKSEEYEGVLELRRTGQGLLLINELPLETYLCGVVSSEMPASYPEEALKAQAVCARTYAAKCVQRESAGTYFADMDDSVSYQVYNNQDRTDATDAAVRQTAGVVLEDGNGLIDALYYSTSCGLDTGIDLSQEAVFAALLSEDSVRALEAEEPWYRWQADVLLADLENAAELAVSGRMESGAASELLVTGTDGAQRIIEGEYDIRDFLAGPQTAVALQDGETIRQMELLPSAFFVMRPLYDGDVLYGYHLLGGGYGHGIGMSQNGAKHMALAGMDYREILAHYYRDAQLILA